MGCRASHPEGTQQSPKAMVGTEIGDHTGLKCTQSHICFPSEPALSALTLIQGEKGGRHSFQNVLLGFLPAQGPFSESAQCAPGRRFRIWVQVVPSLTGS